MSDFQKNSQALPPEKLRFSMVGVPEEERRDASLIAVHFFNLTMLIEQFRHAIGLVEHCIDLRRSGMPDEATTQWANMAGFHAAFTIYHFRSSLLAIRERVGHCPSVRPKVDTKALEQTVKAFEALFPDAKNVRDAAGHAADRMFKPTDVDEHGSGEEGRMIPGQIHNHWFVIGHRQGIVGVEMSPATTDKLEDIRARVTEALGTALVA